MLNRVHSYSQFQPLKEVWIGGTYPQSFYSHLSAKHQDIFGRLTEITHQDFQNLQQTLTKLGVTVQQPRFDCIDYFLDDEDHLLKPPISPCDFALTMGETLYICPQYPTGHDPYMQVIEQYQSEHCDVHIIDRSGVDPWAWIIFPSVVRLGRDVLIDFPRGDVQRRQCAVQVAQALEEKYRVHLSDTGDHSDGVFCPIAPGRILTSHYRQHYNNTMPNWDVFHLNHDPYATLPIMNHQRWYVEGIDYLHFNDAVLSVAENWLGQPYETVFDVNILVVDEHNLVCTGTDENTFRWFESFGMTPHVVDIKSKAFWDAGIHCMTSDICRTGEIVDYWPQRPATGRFDITEW